MILAGICRQESLFLPNIVIGNRALHSSNRFNTITIDLWSDDEAKAMLDT